MEKALVSEWNRGKDASDRQVKQVEDVEFVVQESNAAVAHPDTVMVKAHYAGVTAQGAVLSPGWLDTPAWFTVTKPTNLGNLLCVFAESLLLSLS